MDENSTVVGQSHIFRGRTNVLFEQEWGAEKEKTRHVAVRFDHAGNAQAVGIFNEFKRQMVEQLNDYKRAYDRSIERHGKRKGPTFEPLSGQKKKESLIKIKYAKDFFINEEGEIIKIAAVVSIHPTVLQALGLDHTIRREQSSTAKLTEQKDSFTSVFEIESTDYTENDCAFKVIVFHCLDEEHQD